MNSKRGGGGGQGRPTGYHRTANNEYEEIKAPPNNNQQASTTKRGGGQPNKAAFGNAPQQQQNAQPHRVVHDTSLNQKKEGLINEDDKQQYPPLKEASRGGNSRKNRGGNNNGGQQDQQSERGGNQQNSRGGGRGSQQNRGANQPRDNYNQFEEPYSSAEIYPSQGKGRGRGRGTPIQQQLQHAQEFYPQQRATQSYGGGKDNNQYFENYQKGMFQGNQFYTNNQQQIPPFTPYLMSQNSSGSGANQWVGDYQQRDYYQNQLDTNQHGEQKGTSQTPSQGLSSNFRPGPPGVIRYAKQPKTRDQQRQQPLSSYSQNTVMQDHYLQQYDQKLSFDDPLEEKVIQDKRNMNICFGYKDFMKADFFQGPTYIFLKERSKIKNHKYPEEKPAEDDNSYEVAQFPPIRPQPVLGQRPPRKHSDSNQESEKKGGKNEESKPQVFDAKAEKKKGNKFWNELEGALNSNASGSKKKSSGLLKKVKKSVSHQLSFNNRQARKYDKERKGKKPWKEDKNKEPKKRINFEEYLQVEEEIKKGIADGRLFEGNLRVNPNNRNRAFVSIQGIKVDVMIDGLSSQNRALDGDTVLIQLLHPNRWPSLITQNIIVGGKKWENKGFTNETAIETRVVDADRGLSDTQPNQSSLAQVEEKKVVTSVQLPPKHVTVPNILGDSDHEGEEQGESVKESSSDSSSEDEKLEKFIEQEEEKLVEGTRFQNDQLVESSSDDGAEEIFDNDEEEEISDDENSEVKRNPFKHEKERQIEPTYHKKTHKQNAPTEKKHDAHKAKQRTYFGIGKSRAEILKMVNEIAVDCRPCGLVKAILKSPNREREQMITLTVQDKDRLDDQSFLKLLMGEIPASAKDKKGQISTKVAMNCGIYAVPVSKKLPWMSLANIPQELIDDIKNDKKPQNRYYIAKFESWNVGFIRPVCRIISNVGEAGNLEAESLRILKTHDVWCDEYEADGQKLNEKVHESLRVFTKNIDEATGEWRIPQEEIKLRIDLRQKRIFTIDPITAKDLDDALSIDKITDTIYEIGVHIADVSYFVQQGTELDYEAQLRCTSVYFVHRVYPMLPRLLCERLCSLNPQVDRLSYSIFFRLNINTGEVDRSFQPKLARTIMRSCAKWNYQLVQDILDKKITREDQLPEQFKPKEQKFEDMVADCFLMHEIAQKRRAKRLENGSIMLSNREFMFNLDQESKLPESFVESKTRMPSKHLVEEYMLLANILVAEHLHQYCNDKTLLRVHPDLDKEKKEVLQEYYEKVGMKGIIDLTNSKTLSNSLEALKDQGDSSRYNVAMRKFLTCLQCAKYMCINESPPEQYQHYGLNFPLYTHFTSPIRRYADLLVHRLVTLTLSHGEKTRDLIELMDYSEYAETCSEKSLNAKRASTQCTRLFHCLLLKQQGIKAFETLLFDMDQSGNIVVYIDEVNLHHKIKLRDDPRIDSVIFFEEEMVMVAHVRQDNSDKTKPKVSPGERLDEFRKITKLSQITEKDSNFAPEELLIFRIFDKVKVRVDTTTDFPLDIICTVVFGKEDLEDFARLAQEQEAAAHIQAEGSSIIGGQQPAADNSGVVEINNLDADV